jgi:hypothetical protein
VEEIELLGFETEGVENRGVREQQGSICHLKVNDDPDHDNYRGQGMGSAEYIRSSSPT